MSSRLVLIVKLLLTALVLAFIFTKIDLSEIRADYNEMDHGFLFAGLLLTIPNLSIQFFKWRYLVRMIEASVPGRECWSSLMAGFTIGLVTPGRIGEIGKGVFIRSARRNEFLGMGFLDKLLSQMALGLLGFASLLAMSAWVFSWPAAGVITVGVTALVFVGFMALIAFKPEAIRAWLRSLKRGVYGLPWDRKVFQLLDAADAFRRHHFLPSLLYALAFQTVIALQIYCFVNVFDRLTFWNAVAAGSAAMLMKSLLPVAMMDIGVREGALIFFLGHFSIAASTAFNASVLLFLSNVLFPGAMGVYYVIRFKPMSDAER